MNAIAVVAAILLPVLAAASCGNNDSMSSPQLDAGGGGDAPTSVVALCGPVHSHESIPQRASATREDPVDTFSNLAGEIELQCGGCHKSPAIQGGFSYDSTAKGLCEAKGVKGNTPAQMMMRGDMPRGIGGQQALGRKLQAWVDQGCPPDKFKLPKGDAPVNSGNDLLTTQEVGAAMTDLGSCIPTKEIIGQDTAADARFGAMHAFTDLPDKLSETDIVSLDAEALAKKGTIAYAPAYPLWTDDAGKLRFVHVPAGQSIAYDPQTKHFRIPANTRFYKTFLKAVVEKDGKVRYRKMETRLIVTRDKQEDALFGTYVWNAEETGAKLLGSGLNPDSPNERETYLNGTPFRDYARPYTINDTTGETRNYGVPGSERCIACHRGSEGQNFVLGFTPLQINRRPKGEGGVLADDVLEDERGQAERLIAYGVVTGIAAADLPKLEESALPRKPRNDDELRMQGYMVGNCAHCHNPNGYAVQSTASLRALNMAPGGAVFGFDFKTRGSNNIPYFTVDPSNLPDQTQAALTNSSFYARVVLPTGAFDRDAFGFPRSINGEQAAFNFHMPLHTPGVDCRLPVLVARWWGAAPRDFTAGGVEAPDNPIAVADGLITADRAEQRAKLDCKPPAEVNWVLEDATERDPYIPRNITWPDKLEPWIRALDVTPAHEELAKKIYYQGYFEGNCKFPNDTPPPPNEEPWMRNPKTGNPRRPFSALYAVNPGEHIYAGICATCHGVRGDAQTGAARALRAADPRGGPRVANFIDGLVGPRTRPAANIDCFDKGFPGTTGCAGGLGANGAAKYLVWMATGGTTVSFGRTPLEETTFFDAFVSSRALTAVPIPVSYIKVREAFKSAKANMLGVARFACDRIRTDADGYGKKYDDSIATKDWELLLSEAPTFGIPMWRDVCTLNNPLTDALRTADPNSAEVQAWLQKAVFNAGTMVFLYLRDELSRGKIVPARNACELKYPTE